MFSCLNVYRLIVEFADGQLELRWLLFHLFLSLCGGLGTGLILIVFDPTKILRTGQFGLHRLVQPSPRSTFFEKIDKTSDDEYDDSDVIEIEQKS